MRCQAAGTSGGQPRALQHALLPRLAPRNVRPARDADRAGPDRGPDVDERMPHDQHVGRSHAGRDPALLGARHQVVHEHARGGGRARGRTWSRWPAGRRCLPGTPPRPPRPAGHRPRSSPPARRRACPRRRSGSPGPPWPGLRRRRHRPGGRPRRPGRRRSGGGRHQRDRLPVQQERRGREREHPPLAVPVFERHRALLVTDHRPAEPALGVLHHQAALGLDLRHLARRPAAPRSPGLSVGQYVRAVLPAPHGFSPSWV